MLKPFEFDHPYTLRRQTGGAFMLDAHGITVASFDPKSWGSEQACIEAAWSHAYVAPGDRITLEGLRGAVARGWCAPENAEKEMDPDLAEAIVREVYDLLQGPAA